MFVSLDSSKEESFWNLNRLNQQLKWDIRVVYFIALLQFTPVRYITIHRYRASSVTRSAIPIYNIINFTQRVCEPNENFLPLASEKGMKSLSNLVRFTHHINHPSYLTSYIDFDIFSQCAIIKSSRSINFIFKKSSRGIIISKLNTLEISLGANNAETVITVM